MPTVPNTVRVTTPRTSVWRHCSRCDDLAAMPPEVTLCDPCQYEHELELSGDQLELFRLPKARKGVA